MLENLHQRALLESIEGSRKGDRIEETESIQRFLRSGNIGIVTSNNAKFNIAKNALSLFGLESIQVKVPTNCFDLTPMPALFKALSGRNFSDANVFLARGRLGIAGSGSLTVMVDREGRLLSAVTSPPHHITGFSIELATFLDIFKILRRLGLISNYSGITEKTETIYSSLTFLDVARAISYRKFDAIKGSLIGKTCLLIGLYLDGLFFLDKLRNFFEDVYCFDKEKTVLSFCKNKVLNSIYGKNFDTVIDLSGYGGFRQYKNINFKRLIVEKPLSESKLPDNCVSFYANGAKTSGTMTLSVATIRRACDDLENLSGVFYAVPNLLPFESLLFNVKSKAAFMDAISFPAVTVSAMKDSLNQLDIDRAVKSRIEAINVDVQGF